MFATVVGFQTIDQFFDILHPVFVRDQHHIGGFDNHQIRHA